MCFVLFLFNFFFIELIESIKWKCNWVVGGWVWLSDFENKGGWGLYFP